MTLKGVRGQTPLPPNTDIYYGNPDRVGVGRCSAGFEHAITNLEECMFAIKSGGRPITTTATMDTDSHVCGCSYNEDTGHMQFNAYADPLDCFEGSTATEQDADSQQNNLLPICKNQAMADLTCELGSGPSPASCNWDCYLLRYQFLREKYGYTTLEAAKHHFEHVGEQQGLDCTCTGLEPTFTLEPNTGNEEFSVMSTEAEESGTLYIRRDFYKIHKEIVIVFHNDDPTSNNIYFSSEMPFSIILPSRWETWGCGTVNESSKCEAVRQGGLHWEGEYIVNFDAGFMDETVFDLNAATQSGTTVIDSKGGLEFGTYPVSDDGDRPHWDLSDDYLELTSGELVQGESYTHAYLVKWRADDNGNTYRTLLRHSPGEHCALVFKNSLEFGYWSRRSGGWRGTGSDINTPDQSRFRLVVVTGQGNLNGQGTSTFYLENPTGMSNVGTADRVCSGLSFHRLGHAGQAPGKIARVLAWDRVLEAREIDELYNKLSTVTCARTYGPSGPSKCPSPTMAYQLAAADVINPTVARCCVECPSVSVYYASVTISASKGTEVGEEFVFLREDWIAMTGVAWPTTEAQTWTVVQHGSRNWEGEVIIFVEPNDDYGRGRRKEGYAVGQFGDDDVFTLPSCGDELYIQPSIVHAPAPTLSLLESAELDLNAATQSGTTVVDSKGGLEFGTYRVSDDGDGPYWDLADNELRLTSGELVQSESYTHAFLLKWRPINTGNHRVLLRHSDGGSKSDGCGVVLYNSYELGFDSKRSGGRRDAWRATGADINTPDQSRFHLVVITGHGNVNGHGISTFYIESGAGMSSVGTADRVCSGLSFHRVGETLNGPGKVARVLAWNRVLSPEEINELYATLVVETPPQTLEECSERCESKAACYSFDFEYEPQPKCRTFTEKEHREAFRVKTVNNRMYCHPRTAPEASQTVVTIQHETEITQGFHLADVVARNSNGELLEPVKAEFSSPWNSIDECLDGDVTTSCFVGGILPFFRVTYNESAEVVWVEVEQRRAGESEDASENDYLDGASISVTKAGVPQFNGILTSAREGRELTSSVIFPGMDAATNDLLVEVGPDCPFGHSHLTYQECFQLGLERGLQMTSSLEPNAQGTCYVDVDASRISYDHSPNGAPYFHCKPKAAINNLETTAVTLLGEYTSGTPGMYCQNGQLSSRRSYHYPVTKAECEALCDESTECELYLWRGQKHCHLRVWNKSCKPSGAGYTLYRKSGNSDSCTDSDLTTYCEGESMEFLLEQPMMLMHVRVRNRIQDPTFGSYHVEVFDGRSWIYCTKDRSISMTDWIVDSCSTTVYAERIRISGASEGQVVRLAEVFPVGLTLPNWLAGENDDDAVNREECRGHCDSDAQCRPGLKCFKRSGFTRVPGCEGDGKKDWNYCYDPTTGLMDETVFDLNAATQSGTTVIDSKGGLEFGTYPVSDDGDGPHWDLSDDYLQLTSGELVQGESYTHAYLVKWRADDNSNTYRTLLRHSPGEHCALVFKNTLEFGYWSKRSGGWRGSGSDINTPDQSRFRLVVVTGQGDLNGFGTSTFYLENPTGMSNVGTADRVCSGLSFHRLGHPGQAPGKIARVLAWDRVLESWEIDELYNQLIEGDSEDQIDSSLESDSPWVEIHDTSSCKSGIMHTQSCDSGNCDHDQLQATCRDLGLQCWGYALTGSSVEFYSAEVADPFECEGPYGLKPMPDWTTYRRRFHQWYEVELDTGSCYTYNYATGVLTTESTCNEEELGFAEAVAWELDGISKCALKFGWEAIHANNQICEPWNAVRKSVGPYAWPIYLANADKTKVCFDADRRRAESNPFEPAPAPSFRRQTADCFEAANIQKTRRCNQLQEAMSMNAEIVALETERTALQDARTRQAKTYAKWIGALDVTGQLFSGLSGAAATKLGSSPTIPSSGVSSPVRRQNAQRFRRREELWSNDEASVARRRVNPIAVAAGGQALGTLTSAASGILGIIDQQNQLEHEKELRHLQSKIDTKYFDQANLRHYEHMAEVCMGASNDDLACHMEELGMSIEQQRIATAEGFNHVYAMLQTHQFQTIQAFETQNAILEKHGDDLKRIEELILRMQHSLEELLIYTRHSAKFDAIQEATNIWKEIVEDDDMAINNLDTMSNSQSEWCDMFDHAGKQRVASHIAQWVAHDDFLTVAKPFRNRETGEEDLWTPCEKEAYEIAFTENYNGMKRLYDFVSNRWMILHDFPLNTWGSIKDQKGEMGVKFNEGLEYIRSLDTTGVIRCVDDEVSCPQGMHFVPEKYVTREPCEVNECVCPTSTSTDHKLVSTLCTVHEKTEGCQGTPPQGYHTETLDNGLDVFRPDEPFCTHGEPEDSVALRAGFDGKERCKEGGCDFGAKFDDKLKICVLYECSCLSGGDGGVGAIGAECPELLDGKPKSTAGFEHDHCSECGNVWDAQRAGMVTEVPFEIEWFELEQGCSWDYKDTFRTNWCRESTWEGRIWMPISVEGTDVLEVEFTSDECLVRPTPGVPGCSQNDYATISLGGKEVYRQYHKKECMKERGRCRHYINLSDVIPNRSEFVDIKVHMHSKTGEAHYHASVKLEYKVDTPSKPHCFGWNGQQWAGYSCGGSHHSACGCDICNPCEDVPGGGHAINPVKYLSANQRTEARTCGIQSGLIPNGPGAQFTGK